ncbi:MAG: hypothetical protein AAFZ07_25675 [Actinomycetota bacterium]
MLLNEFLQAFRADPARVLDLVRSHAMLERVDGGAFHEPAGVSKLILRESYLRR